MSTVIILYECTAATAITAGTELTLTGVTAGVYSVREAEASDIVDGVAVLGAANGDKVTVAGGPMFGQRLSE